MRRFRFRALQSDSESVRRSSQFPWNGKVKAIARLNARIPESGMQPEETSIDRIACPKTIFVSDEISRESTVRRFSPFDAMRRRTRKFATLYEHWPSLYVLFYFTPNGLVPPVFQRLSPANSQFLFSQPSRFRVIPISWVDFFSSFPSHQLSSSSR